MACQTQWRYAGMGRRAGLDYAGVQAVMDLQAIEARGEVFQRVQILERALLAVDAEKADASGRKG